MQLKEERLRSLLIRGLVGDASAYHLFLGELTAHLRSFLRRRMSRLPEETEDLVQELLLAIHNQRHTYDPGQPLTAWVQAIARYKLVDLLRRWVTIDGPFLFSANSPSRSVSRYAVYGQQIIQDAAVVATFNGNPTDIAYRSGLAAAVDGDGTVSHVTVFSVNEDGKFTLRGLATIGNATTNGIAIVRSDERIDY
jgi:hypothetical protein